MAADDLGLMLGRMEGKLDMILNTQREQSARLDAFDNRLRHVETQAAKSGALGGAIAAVGTAIAVEIAKRAVL
ncbi:hypothetical protein [Chitiniphilus eburneus]|uniref:hypothetical protein n=1 Tax=Chitiniphilus eburneus TaxID=2571148 RepID=UPI0035D09017